jgi:hypothetical protein
MRVAPLFLSGVGASPAQQKRPASFRKNKTMSAAVYEPSPIKRQRSTRAEVEARREAFLEIIDAGRPMTVRQVFDVGRGVRLARHAYRSRTGAEPPAIIEARFERTDTGECLATYDAKTLEALP